MKANETPHGVVKGAEDRFWADLGENASTVAHRLNTDPGFLAYLVSCAKDGPPLSEPMLSFAFSLSISLDKIARKETGECFIGPKYAWRDRDFDQWLPADQPATDPCIIWMLIQRRPWRFMEAACSILDVPVANVSAASLDALLKERGHTVTLAQVEEAVTVIEGSVAAASFSGAFFFVEGKKGISVGHIRPARRQRLRTDIHQLDDPDLWKVTDSLLVPNLDPAILNQL